MQDDNAFVQPLVTLGDDIFETQLNQSVIIPNTKDGNGNGGNNNGDNIANKLTPKMEMQYASTIEYMSKKLKE